MGLVYIRSDDTIRLTFLSTNITLNDTIDLECTAGSLVKIMDVISIVKEPFCYLDEQEQGNKIDRHSLSLRIPREVMSLHPCPKLGSGARLIK